jgi:hypothetical protein
VTSCIVKIAASYIMVAKCRNTLCPPPQQLSLHRRAALLSKSNGTRPVYSRKNPKNSQYCEVSMGKTFYYSTDFSFDSGHFLFCFKGTREASSRPIAQAPHWTCRLCSSASYSDSSPPSLRLLFPKGTIQILRNTEKNKFDKIFNLGRRFCQGSILEK